MRQFRIDLCKWRNRLFSLITVPENLTGLYISQTQANSPINPDSKHFLCPVRGGNQLFPDPFRLGIAGFTHRPRDLVIFRRRQSRGNEFAALLFLGKRRPANFVSSVHLAFLGLGHIGLALRAISAVRPKQGFQQFAGFVVIRILLRRRNQVQLVFGFCRFHDINVTHLFWLINCFCVTFICTRKPVFKFT